MGDRQKTAECNVARKSVAGREGRPSLAWAWLRARHLYRNNSAKRLSLSTLSAADSERRNYQNLDHGNIVKLGLSCQLFNSKQLNNPSLTFNSHPTKFKSRLIRLC